MAEEANEEKNETTPQPGFHIIDGNDRTSDEELSWLTGKLHEVTLELHLENQAQIKRWCEENCIDTVVYYKNTASYNPDRMYFYLETDAVAFKLRWS